MALKASQRTNKQLTTLTVLMLTVLTVLTQMPAKSAAAALGAAKMHNNNAKVTLPAINAAEALSNQQSAVFQQLIDSTAGAQRGRRKRLRKRHNNNMRLSRLAVVTNEADAIPEWVNSCNFEKVDNAAAAASNNNMMDTKKVMKMLRGALRAENTTINALHVIDVNDMDTWRLHNLKYKFLPTLNRTAKIELHHWHRAMQKFVASFAELGVKQYRYDLKNLQLINATTRELNALLLSARRTLCELETAILTVNPQAKIRTITREEMQKKLNFYAKDQALVDMQGVNSIDLRFAKQRYNKYVQHMLQIVRRQLKAALKKKGDRASAKSVASYSDESNYSLADFEGYDMSAQASHGVSDELLLAA